MHIISFLFLLDTEPKKISQKSKRCNKNNMLRSNAIKLGSFRRGAISPAAVSLPREQIVTLLYR